MRHNKKQKIVLNTGYDETIQMAWYFIVATFIFTEYRINALVFGDKGRLFRKLKTTIINLSRLIKVNFMHDNKK